MSLPSAFNCYSASCDTMVVTNSCGTKGIATTHPGCLQFEGHMDISGAFRLGVYSGQGGLQISSPDHCR